ncbi:MAG: NHLP bacteriocin system secretion protein [bacterium]|nr:NHLP bacteriocin system secretion protein [bacterium]
MAKGFFRQQALDAANRIEALPHTLVVTGSLMRLTMGVLALALAGAVAWSAFVKVPIQIAGLGILVDRSGTLIAPTASASQGYVRELLVGIGDVVTAGQPLVRLTFPDRELEVKRARAEIAAIRRDAQRKQALRASDTASEDDAHRHKVASLEKKIAGLERKTEWLEQRAKDLAGLEAKGFSSAVTVMTARVAQEEAAEQLIQARADRTTLDAQREQSGSQREREALADKFEIERLEEKLTALTASLAADGELRADVAGQIASVNTHHGALVASGQQVIDILSAGRGDGRLEAILFVPMASGKRVKPGDHTLIAPNSLPEGSHDRLLATVLSVSEIPVSRATLRSLLGNDELADKVAQGGPPFAVRVELDALRGQQGYLWTSARAPAVSLTPGTPVNANVTVEHTPLLVLAVPALKRFIGLPGPGWARDS